MAQADRDALPTTEPESGSIAQFSKLIPTELWWSTHYTWLEKSGYLLRPRYKPDWVPSWQGTSEIPFECEDWILPLYASILDATRISDGEFVILKAIIRIDHPSEVEIGCYLMSEPLRSDPMNHCVPILDVLHPPDRECDIIVMPLLRSYDDPPFETVGEVVGCLRQLFEGLYFMHKNHVAHRDCMNLNIMMDPKPLFIDSFHPFRSDRTRDLKGDPRYYSRTQRPAEYFFIDFGLSRRYDPSVISPLEPIIIGGDDTVPEFKTLEPKNPFPTDVYYLGHAFQETFLGEYNGLEFIEPLILDMVQEDPSRRPTMEEALRRLETICQGLRTRKLRSRLMSKQETPFQCRLKNIAHWPRRIWYIVRRHPAVPCPKQRLPS